MMFLRYLKLLLLVGVGSLVLSLKAEKNMKKNFNIVAFGDSITRGYAVPVGSGWVALLPELLKEQGLNNVSVFNAGGNGNTSTEGLKRIKQVLSRMPGVVTVEFGGNDAVHTSRHVSVDDFEKNILDINKQVKGKGGEIILMTFPPVINDWHAQGKNPFYKKWGGLDQCIEQYRQCTRELAKSLNCPLIDLDKFLREQVKSRGAEEIILKDGIHLTVKGNQLVADEILSFLVKHLEK